MQAKRKNITILLFIIYLLILTWIVLFKMTFSFNEMPNLRNINLIPYAESTIVNNSVDYSEIIYNSVAFIPVGVYITMLRSNWSFLKKIIPVLALSIFYEVMQFIFAIGATDITDVINNTIGGIVGILFYVITSKLIKNKEKVDKIIIVLASICTGLLVVFLSILVLANL
ncbi:MAG: VanZ family protein [Lachnospiraceae bacterium]